MRDSTAPSRFGRAWLVCVIRIVPLGAQSASTAALPSVELASVVFASSAGLGASGLASTGTGDAGGAAPLPLQPIRQSTKRRDAAFQFMQSSTDVCGTLPQWETIQPEPNRRPTFPRTLCPARRCVPYTVAPPTGASSCRPSPGLVPTTNPDDSRAIKRESPVQAGSSTPHRGVRFLPASTSAPT